MSRNTWQYAWAALLAALVVSCDLTEPPEPPPPPEAPQVSVLAPLPGARINWTKPPETPVVLIGRATHRGRKLAADSTEWTANGAFAGRGDTITVSVPVGEVLAVYTARADGFAVADSVRFLNPADSLVVHIATPEDGRVYKWDEPVNCAVLVTIIPPRPYEKRTSHKLNGQPVSCNGDRQFVSGAPPAPIVFAAGEYAFEACGELVGRNVVICTTAKFTVKARPWQVVFTKAGSGQVDPRDFYIVDEDDPKTLTALTSDGTHKTWPILSSDGSMLAWIAKDGDWCYEVFVAPVSNLSNRRKVSSWPGESCASGSTQAPYFSPDGKRIAYIGGWTPPGLVNSEFAAFVVNVDGTGRRRLPTRTCQVTGGRSGPPPCFANTSHGRIIFHSKGEELILMIQEVRSDDSYHDVVVSFRIEDGRITRLLNVADEDGVAEVSDLSIQGEWVVLATFWSRRLMLIRTDGSGEYRFLTPPGNFGRSWFCYGGAWICYVPSTKSGSFRRVNLDGTVNEEVMELFPQGFIIETPYRHPLFPK